MTMSNQMALSAASVAVMANNNTLVNMGAMQESFFELDGSTINAGLEATSLQATAEEKSIMDQANAQQTQAIGSLIGSGMGIVSTATGLIKGLSNYNEANALDESSNKLAASVSQTDAQPTTELQPPKPAAPVVQPAVDNSSNPRVNVTGQVSDDSFTTDTAQSIAKVKAQLQTSVNTQESSDLNAQDANETAETKKAENPDAKALRSYGDMWLQNGSTFGNLFSGVGKSAGDLKSYDAMTDQAKQAKIKDLEAGLAQALSSQASLIGSQLGNLDQSRGNTYQLMSTLQQVRG